MCSDAVIRARDISKTYQVYDSPRDRLAQFIVPRVQRAVGLQPKTYYRSFDALQKVSFDVRKGETVGIIGRNGSGKSTLLQIICGTLFPTSGAAVVEGRIAALLELGSGFNPEFTGRENVYLNAALLGMTRREVDQRYEAIASFAAIGDFIDQPIKTYSSGMVVRLAFATAIHVEPDLLIVDEALAVGDTAFQQKCLHKIREMQREGVSILLVTHSSNAVIEFCDRGIYLRKGEVVMDGACRDVVKRYSDDLLEEEGSLMIDVPPAQQETTVASPDLHRGSMTQMESHALIIESAVLLDESDLPVSVVASNDIVKVQVRILVERTIQFPCFGLQISSVDGIALWSVTTQAMNLTPGELGPGLYVFEWCFTANFSGNRYVLAIGAGELRDGEYKRLHRLDYAGHFDVLPIPHAGGGWLAPRPDFKIGLLREHRND